MACQWQPASCFLCASARAADLLRSPPVIPPSQGCAPQQLCHLPQGAGSLRSQCAGRRRGSRHSPLRYRPAAGRRSGCPGTLMPSGGGTACGMLSTLAARHLRAGLSAHQGCSHHREPYGRPSGALPADDTRQVSAIVFLRIRGALTCSRVHSACPAKAAQAGSAAVAPPGAWHERFRSHQRHHGRPARSSGGRALVGQLCRRHHPLNASTPSTLQDGVVRAIGPVST